MNGRMLAFLAALGLALVALLNTLYVILSLIHISEPTRPY